ncbi:MAG: hypothetical protein ACJAXL_000635 [Alphaproteobacteria bacterium]|jgi:uncharacterized protein YecT (DUF1311 family)
MKIKTICLTLISLTIVNITCANAGNMSDIYTVRIKGIEYTLEQCLDPEQVDSTTQSSIYCVNMATKSLDDLMNEIWSSMKQAIKDRPTSYHKNAKPFQAMLDAQRKWLEFRKLKCAYYYTRQGTLYSQMAASCYYHETLERTKDINSILYISSM